MRKITELPETKYRTVREKDATGNRVARQVTYTGYRKVNVMSGGKRFAHAFVDGMVYYVIYYFFEYIWLNLTISKDDSVANLVNNMMTGFFISVIFMFAFPIYYIVFEHFFQKTPGKFLTKAIVIDIYGNKPELGNNMLRNVIRLVPFEVFSCLNERGWHDRWSDTFVVSEEEYVTIKELQFKLANEENITTAHEEVKPVNKPLVKNIFLYAVLPLCLVLYIGIIVKSCTGAKTAITNLKDKNGKSVFDTGNKELSRISELYIEGQIDEAQQQVLKFIRTHKNNAEAWTLLGDTYCDQMDYAPAIEAYKKSISLNATDFTTHNKLGMAYLENKNYNMVLNEFKKANSLDAFNSTTISNMSHYYNAVGDFKNLLKFSKQAVKLDTTDQILWANLAVGYFKNDQFKDRDDVFNKLKKLGYADIAELQDIIYPINVIKGNVNVRGTVSHMHSAVPLKDIKFEVFNKDSALVKKVNSDENGKYYFSLPLNKSDNYTVKVSYPKHVTKYFSINTAHVPFNEWKTKIPRLQIDMSLSERLANVDYSYLDKPLNYYFFDTITKHFTSDAAMQSTSYKKMKALKLIEEKAKKEMKL